MSTMSGIDEPRYEYRVVCPTDGHPTLPINEDYARTVARVRNERCVQCGPGHEHLIERHLITEWEPSP